jgi:YebC/PmpR family DNA-binding regulatory protein
MSGHSKWANIKHRKGKQDAVRGKMFTKIARQLTVAAKDGGTDPEYNAGLKSAIEMAKAANMPNDNIKRAIQKGAGGADGVNYEEIRYEGYGSNGVAVIVDCLTDNKKRTVADIKYYFDKNGGNMGTTGSVAFMFDRKGILLIDRDAFSIDEDEMMMQALEAGAEDFEATDEFYEIITDPNDFSAVRDALLAAEISFIKAELTYIPQMQTAIPEESYKNMNRMLDAMEENDDIQNVYHNWDMPEEEE